MIDNAIQIQRNLKRRVSLKDSDYGTMADQIYIHQNNNFVRQRREREW